ncbi:hypothetical protein NBO_929g0006 [Nosema bombycis CQ1]|uniref:Uncharacterized protein n=1 Tax=Nosema bombycis (strain CQ1 / CVCC 102059) TaxID=578461 RepID=R0MG16_NOSB1|nr:hypothetical protein NBO_929g0006 [Nosema bombycis CQ1]|eukprot:EOB11708.1 hypothetical protein NBO_929g0006 [Nosema bombycis CQ1]
MERGRSIRGGGEYRERGKSIQRYFYMPIIIYLYSLYLIPLPPVHYPCSQTPPFSYTPFLLPYITPHTLPLLLPFFFVYAYPPFCMNHQEIHFEFCKVFECQEINKNTILKVLKDLNINFQQHNLFPTHSITFYKSLNSLLIDFYKSSLNIDISKKIYSKNEIIGLLVFLYLRKFKKEPSRKLEDFLEKIFFSETSENALKEENEELKNKINKSKNIDDINYDFIDYEVLKKLEKENIKLKKIIKFENDLIIKSWFNLCEEYLKRG